MTFFTFSQDRKNVVLLDHWTDTSIEKGLEDAVFNDVWGFTRNGNNYCVIGSSAGTHFFSVEDNQLTLLDFKPGKYQSQFVEHRDFKVYGNYLYGVCDEGTSSLQIFDLTYLPDSVSKVYDSDSFFTICHNIYIDTLNAKLYACGANNMGMQVLSLENPTNPELLYAFNEVDYVHDCYVRNDTAFLNCGFEGLHVYDFSSAIPQQKGILDFYPNQGYNHSGWLSVDGKSYAFIDETEGTKVKLCNWLEDLSTLSISETFGTKEFQDFVPHNVILLNNLAFVSYYNEGLRIFDFNRSPVKEIASYDTFEQNTGFKLNGAWGVFVFPDQNQILISDRQNGLFLFSFPITILDNGGAGTVTTNIPFLNENGYIIPRDHLDETSLSFSIATVTGSIVYEQANFLNYVNIPLELAPGTYVFAIYDEFGDFLESGKFVVAN